MMDGVIMRPEWSADNLDYHPHVRISGSMSSVDKISITLAPIALTEATYGQGQGPILLDNVQCNGDESSLQECPHLGVGNHNCGHHEDASVICSSGRVYQNYWGHVDTCT